MNEANTGGRTYCAIVVLAPRRNSPEKWSVSRFISKSSCRYAASKERACESNSSPARVSRT